MLGSFKDAKWRYIDKTGKFVVNRDSDFPADFNNGLAYVSYDGVLTYIDKTGKVIWSASSVK
jgi:hypothetical protein